MTHGKGVKSSRHEQLGGCSPGEDQVVDSQQTKTICSNDFWSLLCWTSIQTWLGDFYGHCFDRVSQYGWPVYRRHRTLSLSLPLSLFVSQTHGSGTSTVWKDKLFWLALVRLEGRSCEPLHCLSTSTRASYSGGSFMGQLMDQKGLCCSSRVDEHPVEVRFRVQIY